jgi:hypothetical protein
MKDCLKRNHSYCDLEKLDDKTVCPKCKGLVSYRDCKEFVKVV